LPRKNEFREAYANAMVTILRQLNDLCFGFIKDKKEEGMMSLSFPDPHRRKDIRKE
jgi:hypothetical protein